MKKVVLLLTMAVILGKIATAQNAVSNIETVKGKTATQAESVTKTKYSEAFELKVNPEYKQDRPMLVNPEINQDRPVIIRQDGKSVTRDGRLITQKEKLITPKGNFITSADKKITNFDAESGNRQKTPKISDTYNEERAERVITPTVSVRKSDRDDVATVTLRVIGDPMAELGYENAGFQMLLDADCELYDVFWDYFWSEWQLLYEISEYTIPEGATSDLQNSPIVLDDEVTIEIPEGIYDFAFIIPLPADNSIGVTGVVIAEEFYRSCVGSFLFKAGINYLFEVEMPQEVVFFNENDVGLSKIILPPKSLQLSNEEEVTVVIKNYGISEISSDVELSYSVNDGTPVVEIYTITSLAPGDELNYTFTTKADFSEDGLYIVEAHIDYNLDLIIQNNYITGYTKKQYPLSLPFYEDFSKYENLIEYWTFLDADGDGFSWVYDTLNEDADGIWGGGCMQVSTIPWVDELYASDDYLITDPINIPENGAYNLFFYHWDWGSFPFTVLFGTTSNPNEMQVLKEFQNFNNWDWDIEIINFEIEIPGNYYFAFRFNVFPTDNWESMQFDNVYIGAGSFVGFPDVMFKSVRRPVSSCGMSAEEVICVKVYNRGTAPISEFTLTYQINDENIVTQSFNEIIDIKEFVTVNFDQTVDFSVIGDYNIKLTAETPNELSIHNNEIEITVKLNAPITELPYESDIFNDWNPEFMGEWEKDEWDGDYNTHPSISDYTPLLSNCVYLEPDTYRFTFIVSTWFREPTNDFYVSFGKSGTNPYEWEPAKEYYNYKTEGSWIKFEELFIFEITEAGVYEFGFFLVRLETGLSIFGTTIEVAPEYDFSIENIDAGAIARITPVYQLSGEQTYTATLQNKGKNADVNGNIEVLLNDNVATSVNFAFTETGETKVVELNPLFVAIPIGQISLKFNATIDGGISNEWEILTIASDSTFAYDNVDSDFYFGLGLGEPAGLGLIYELQNADILTSISVGFCEDEEAANINIVLAVYQVNDNNELGNLIFEIERPRTEGNNMEAIVFGVPETLLQPGKYFFEVRQLDDISYVIAIDYDSEGHLWAYFPEYGAFYKESYYGYVHIRPNFGNPPVGISHEKAPETQLTLYPNPSKGIVNVTLDETIIENAVIYNSSGQIIASFSNINDSKFMFDAEKLSSGLYFITVQTKTGIVSSKFVVR